MCVSTWCVLLNGHAPGDPEGAATFVGRDGTSCSVVDYGIAFRSGYPFSPLVDRFAVEPSHGLSLHRPLVLVLGQPCLTGQSPQPQGGRPAVSWEPSFST